MIPAARYRAVAALSRLEGLAHALRVDLAEGKVPGLEVLDSLAQDVAEVRKSITPTDEEMQTHGWYRPSREQIQEFRAAVEAAMDPADLRPTWGPIEWMRRTPSGGWEIPTGPAGARRIATLEVP